MADPNFRTVGHMLRVGDEDVLVTIYEEYPPDNSGVPVHVKVVGPNGLKTEGKPGPAWQEMLELLGVVKREPALGNRQSGVEAASESLQDSQSQNQNPAEAAAGPSTLGPVFGDGGTSSESAQESQSQSPNPAGSKSGQDSRSQNQNQNPAGAAAGPVIQAAVPAEQVSSGVADELEEDMEPQEEGQEEEMEVEEEPGLNQNILRESMIRLLNRRLYRDDPPLKITDNLVRYIPHLYCTQEAANLIGHIDENIKLTEMQADAARRVANLKYLKKANRARRCQHVKFNGESCGSPALRGQQYCHFHTQAHGTSMELPVIEDQRSLQLAYTKLAHKVAANKIDPVQAKVLLQILESAGRNLPDSGT